MNEVLAVAFGNGLIGRIVDRAGFDRSYSRAKGLYNDRFIDPTAKAVMPWLETYLREGKTLYDSDFLQKYLRIVTSVFPTGIAPVLHLRPHVSVYEASLVRVDDHFRRAINGGTAASEEGFDKNGREMLGRSPIWGHAILVLSDHVGAVQGVEKGVDAKVVSALRAEAAKKKPFVWTLARERAEPLYVLVAPDATQLDDLVDRFAALNGTLPPGAWQ